MWISSVYAGGFPVFFSRVLHVCFLFSFFLRSGAAKLLENASSRNRVVRVCVVLCRRRIVDVKRGGGKNARPLLAGLSILSIFLSLFQLQPFFFVPRCVNRLSVSPPYFPFFPSARNAPLKWRRGLSGRPAESATRSRSTWTREIAA